MYPSCSKSKHMLLCEIYCIFNSWGYIKIFPMPENIQTYPTVWNILYFQFLKICISKYLTIPIWENIQTYLILGCVMWPGEAAGCTFVPVSPLHWALCTAAYHTALCTLYNEQCTVPKAQWTVLRKRCSVPSTECVTLYAQCSCVLVYNAALPSFHLNNHIKQKCTNTLYTFQMYHFSSYGSMHYLCTVCVQCAVQCVGRAGEYQAH